MTRICIIGAPQTGKTTLADRMAADAELRHGRAGTSHGPARHTDDLIHLGWSEASQLIADEWLTQDGPWIIEGVAVVRALRKWRDQHPGERPPVDRVIVLTKARAPLSKGQAAMAVGHGTIRAEVEPWLRDHGVEIDER